MFGLGFGELILIFLIALIFIGPKKLPELAKGLGKGIREFQNAAKGFSDQLQNTDHQDATHKKVSDATQQQHDENIAAAPTEEKKDTQES
jgi:sec-independent protein translocase protein TatA